MSLERDITRYIRYDLLGLGGAVPFVLGLAPVSAAGRPKIKVNGAWTAKPVRYRVSGAWIDKPVKVKVDGTFITL